MINLAAIANLLRPGAKAIIGQYETYPEQYKDIFTTFKSDKYQEIEIEMKYLGAADIKPEGSPVAMDSMGQRVITNYIHRTIATGYEISYEALSDNLYKDQFPQKSISVRNALSVTKNTLGANVLNNAFDTSYPVGDGQSLCSDSHPIDGGTYSNKLSNVDFSETSLERALIEIQKFKTQSGIPAQTKAKRLIVPRELQFTVSRLLNSSLRTGTANREISAIYHGDYIPEGYKVNQFLDSTSSWYIITDAPDGLKHYQRENVQIDAQPDFNTKSIRVTAMERYCFGATNPRGVFGVQAA